MLQPMISSEKPFNNLNESTLADELSALYHETRAKLGAEDLAHIRNVANYSKAIKRRSEVLLMSGGCKNSMVKGISLYALHVLLEFSELGHNIMHGGYDQLEGCGEFHSDRWQWGFLADPQEWKVMHHQGHHPFTNIVGKDHDIGYTIARILPGQGWFGHHALQPVLIPVLLLTNLYYISIYTATSAARTEGRKVLTPKTLLTTFRIAKKHLLHDFLKQPLKARGRFLHTLIGNYLGGVLGNTLTLSILGLEHHATNVELFSDPGPEETKGEYYRRQILATTNFESIPKLDAYFQNLLEEEVPFESPPEFRVFYGGLDTHLEHHLFPDLPCNRQREIAPQVKAICLQAGLPYNMVGLEEFFSEIFPRITAMSTPISEYERRGLRDLVMKPAELFKRIAFGLRYKTPPEQGYLAKPRQFNVPVKLKSNTSTANGQACHLSFELPEDWKNIKWDAGAFISLRLSIDETEYIRQYSLTTESAAVNTLDVTVKRVKNGVVSNYINDHFQTGQEITLTGVPVSEGTFILDEIPKKTVFIAGGVGITPVISMIRKIRRTYPDKKPRLLYFNRDVNNILFYDELVMLADNNLIDLHLFCSDVEEGDTLVSNARLSAELLTERLSELPISDVYACAPMGMLNVVETALMDLGLPATQFHTESFVAVAPVLNPAFEKVRYNVHFSRSNLSIEINGNTTLLESAEAVGINVPKGCGRGLCKSCSTTKVSGKTQHDAGGDDVPLERVTICNSFARSHIELDL